MPCATRKIAAPSATSIRAVPAMEAKDDVAEVALEAAEAAEEPKFAMLDPTELSAPPIVWKAPTNFDAKRMIGPMAAAIRPMRMIACCVSGLSAVHASVISWMTGIAVSAAIWIVGPKASTSS